MRLSKKYSGIQFFAVPSVSNLTINFDSHITKVIASSIDWTKDYEWRESGDAKVISGFKGQIATFVVSLESGYVIDTIMYDMDYVTLNSQTDTTFMMTNGIGVFGTVITITSKQGRGGSTMSKSVDLTTLSGWANLADGTHNISVVAKGTGYANSDKSAAVEVTKGSTGETWILKDDHQLQFATRSWSYGVNFVSNGTGYNSFKYSFVSPFESSLKYDDTIVYDVGGSQSWVNQSFRTVVFLPDSLPLPDDLLTWLQANGTKQGGGGTEHTLTFSGVTVTVDGASVTSPYMLTKDCTIVATTLSPDKESMSTAPYININGSSVTSYDETISISKSDIKMLGHKGDTELSVTINYTA